MEASLQFALLEVTYIRKKVYNMGAALQAVILSVVCYKISGLALKNLYVVNYTEVQ